MNQRLCHATRSRKPPESDGSVLVLCPSAEVGGEVPAGTHDTALFPATCMASVLRCTQNSRVKVGAWFGSGDDGGVK